MAPPAPRDADDRRPAADRRGGFTLLELMVVMTVIGFLLMLVPASLDSLGTRSRLESGANTISSVLLGGREQAIIDGHEVLVEFELGDPRRREETGRFRYLVVNRKRERATDAPTEGGPRAPVQEEMIATTWRGLPRGVILSAYSQVPGQWVRRSGAGGGEPLTIRYLADGSVRPSHGWRVESVDGRKGPDNTMTILVNALTATPTVIDGEAELPEILDASDFR